MEAQTVIQALERIPDPRKRQGRQYPLYGLLAILLLATMHGERSLRGMWLWAREREKPLLNLLRWVCGRCGGYQVWQRFGMR